MKKKFVSTENANRFFGAFQKVEERGAEEACLMVVDGVPGLGKTTLVTNWVARNDSILLRAKVEWTPSWLLRELLEELQQRPAHSFRENFRQCVETIHRRSEQAERAGETFALIIDEADHISGSRKIMDTVRDLTDTCEVPTVLVGMGRLRHGLTRSPQTASRVAQYVEFHPASAKDCRKLADGLCEVSVADDLLDFLHTQSKGLIREIKEGLTAIERFGKANGLATVDKTAMAGQRLMYDRMSGKPIEVR